MTYGFGGKTPLSDSHIVHFYLSQVNALAKVNQACIYTGSCGIYLLIFLL